MANRTCVKNGRSYHIWTFNYKVMVSVYLLHVTLSQDIALREASSSNDTVLLVCNHPNLRNSRYHPDLLWKRDNQNHILERPMELDFVLDDVTTNLKIDIRSRFIVNMSSVSYNCYVFDIVDGREILSNTIKLNVTAKEKPDFTDRQEMSEEAQNSTLGQSGSVSLIQFVWMLFLIVFLAI